MPFMIWLEIQKEYILSIEKQETECVYTVADADSGKMISKATTPQEPQTMGPSYYFSLYFGGEETTTEPVTVSYSTQI
jgi:hypothetical protein